jgi:hypothetical protein
MAHLGLVHPSSSENGKIPPDWQYLSYATGFAGVSLAPASGNTGLLAKASDGLGL